MQNKPVTLAMFGASHILEKHTPLFSHYALREELVKSILNAIDNRFDYCDEHSRAVKTFHSFLQITLKYMAKSYGMKGVSEYWISDRGNGVWGFVDVVWVDASYNPIVAIEIDNSNNRSAIFKLMLIDADLKIWIYYGKPYLIRKLHSKNIVTIQKQRQPNSKNFKPQPL